MNDENNFPEAPDELEEVMKHHQFEMVRYLGQGSSAIVYLVQSTKYQQEFVLKRIRNGTLFVEKYDEIKVLKCLCHQGIIHFYDYDIKKEYTYLFIEYCPYGTLTKYITDHGPFDGLTSLAIAKYLLQSLAYIHENKIAHSDIKPSNMLIDVYGRVKFADFGLSTIFDDNESTSKVGSLPYWSPEMLNDKKFDPFAADIWALGISIYYIYQGRLPWAPSTMAGLHYSISHYDINFGRGFNRSLKELLKKMVSPASFRMTAAELLADPILADVDIKYAKIINIGFGNGTKMTKAVSVTKSSTFDNTGSAKNSSLPRTITNLAANRMKLRNRASSINRLRSSGILTFSNNV